MIHFGSKHHLAWLVAAIVVVIPAELSAEQELPANFIVHDRPKPIATISFENWQGRVQNLANFRGKVVLLNLWATWCASCRYEMPSLDDLQGTLGNPDFEVVPLSIDRGGVDVVTKFYADISVRHLAIYTDTSGKALRELGAVGLPTTLVIDRAGQEIGRIVGPAQWDAPEIVNFLKSAIATQSDPAAIAQANPAPVPPSDPEWSRPLMRVVRWLRETFIR